MRVASVVGARPNIIKLAPVHEAIKAELEHIIIHTGQHYDYELSEVFFKEFALPRPHINLEVGSGTPGFQIGEILKRLERIFLKSQIDLVIVYGDTNSTFAGALSATRSGIKVAHVESGLRSFDRRMPEEINRILTDHISDYLFAPTQTALKNLERENIAGNIVYAGDIAVEILKDAIVHCRHSSILKTLNLVPKSYLVLTLHRAENTQSLNNLTAVVQSLEILSEVNIVFPMHPRTERVLKENRFLYSRLKNCRNVKLIKPLGYIDFVELIRNAKKVITDSGGVQKECYLLFIPCITIRDNTEWVETVYAGWNILTGTKVGNIVDAVRDWIPPPARRIESIFGDGQTSEIIKRTIISSIT